MASKSYRPEYDPIAGYCGASQQTSAAPMTMVQPHGNAAVQEAMKANQVPAPAPMTDPTRFSHGQRPSNDNRGPYAFAENNGQAFETGVGLYGDESLQMMSTNFSMGNGYGKPGEQRSGVRADAQMFKGKTNSDGPINGEMSVFDANAQLEAGQDGFAASVGASIISGGVTIGNQNPSADNDMDTAARVQVGLGWSMGVRGQYGDKDNDGVPEVGIGIDTPLISGEVKSEAVGHFTNFMGDNMADAAGHPGGPAPRAYYTNPESAKRNAARPPSWLENMYRWAD
jgi:hypothetical protein